jgi:hypothetical protein
MSPGGTSTFFHFPLKIKYSRRDRVGAKHMAALTADFDTNFLLRVKEQVAKNLHCPRRFIQLNIKPPLPESSMNAFKGGFSSEFTE